MQNDQQIPCEVGLAERQVILVQDLESRNQAFAVEFLVSGFGCQVSGFRFWGLDLGFRVSGFGFWVSGFKFRVLDFGFRVSSFGSRGSGRRLRISSFGFRVSGFGLWVWGFGCGVLGSGFRVWFLVGKTYSAPRDESYPNSVQVLGSVFGF